MNSGRADVYPMLHISYFNKMRFTLDISSNSNRSTRLLEHTGLFYRKNAPAAPYLITAITQAVRSRTRNFGFARGPDSRLWEILSTYVVERFPYNSLHFTFCDGSYFSDTLSTSKRFAPLVILCRFFTSITL